MQLDSIILYSQIIIGMTLSVSCFLAKPQLLQTSIQWLHPGLGDTLRRAELVSAIFTWFQ